MLSYKGNKPQIHETVFQADNTNIIGQVKIGRESGVWFGTVIRGDVNKIEIGEKSNIQENSTVHVDHAFPTFIGDHVTVGHNCIIHGCTLESNTLIGMGSTILDGATIGKNSIVGANSLVTMHKSFPEGSLIIGSPAKVVRQLTQDEITSIQESARTYARLAKDFMEEKKK